MREWDRARLGNTANLTDASRTDSGINDPPESEARAYDRILKVSSTVADLQSGEEISTEHVSEAIQYRTFDRTFGYEKDGILSIA